MRWWIGVALVVGCGCSAADGGGYAPVVGDSELCFRIDREVTELLPGADDQLREALESWGHGLVIDDSCDSALRLAEEPSNEGKAALAVHRPLVKRDGEWTPAGLGGVSEIVLSRPAALDGRIANMSADECNALWDGGHTPSTLLQLILTHEAGHLWGLGESESQDDAMFFSRRVCTEIQPTEVELSLIPPSQ